MKKVLVSGALLTLSLSTASVFADTIDPLVPSAPVVTSVIVTAEPTETLRVNNLAWIKARGALLIKMRVNSLNDNAKAVAASKNLTDPQKQAFAAFFSDEVTKLNALNTGIQAGADATSTKALVTSIFTDFRIYAIVLPQVRLEKRIYELQNHATKLADVFVKVQAAIDEAKVKGKDTTTWQKNLDDAKALVATDNTKLASLLTQIGSLKASDYGTSSKATIIAVNAGVKAVAQDFESLRLKVKHPILHDRVGMTRTINASTSVNVGGPPTRMQ